MKTLKEKHNQLFNTDQHYDEWIKKYTDPEGYNYTDDEIEAIKNITYDELMDIMKENLSNEDYVYYILEDKVNEWLNVLLLDIDKTDIWINQDFFEDTIYDLMIDEKQKIESVMKEADQALNYYKNHHTDNTELAFDVNIHKLRWDFDKVKEKIIQDIKSLEGADPEDKENAIQEVKDLRQDSKYLYDTYLFYQEIRWSFAKEDLTEKYDRVIDVYSAGRSGGWMIIKLDGITNYIDREYLAYSASGECDFTGIADDFEGVIEYFEKEIELVDDLEKDVKKIVEDFENDYEDFVYHQLYQEYVGYLDDKTDKIYEFKKALDNNDHDQALEMYKKALN